MISNFWNFKNSWNNIKFFEFLRPCLQTKVCLFTFFNVYLQNFSKFLISDLRMFVCLHFLLFVSRKFLEFSNISLDFSSLLFEILFYLHFLLFCFEKILGNGNFKEEYDLKRSFIYLPFIFSIVFLILEICIYLYSFCDTERFFRLCF